MSEENIENTTKSDINFAPTFVDRHVLPDINLNSDLVNNIYIHKKVIYLSIYLSIYIYIYIYICTYICVLHNKSTTRKFKHRFY